MKTRTKIIIPIVLVVVLSLFYLYISMNGFSVYDEGIGLTMFDESSLRHHTNWKINEEKLPIYQMTPEDFEQVPKLKVMMDLLLEQEYDAERRGYGALGSDGGSYWINTSSDELKIQTGMSFGEVEKYQKWMHSAETFLLEYKGTVFQIGRWIA